jgi:hypothetical protein
MSWNQIFILCISVGVGILAIGFYFQRRTESIEKWPSTYGKVISAEIKEVISTKRTSGKNVNQATVTTVSYYPSVNYEYYASGKKHTSDQISVSVNGRSTPESIQPILDKYKAGSKVRVFYHPENPDDAVLEKVGDFSILFYFIGGVWLTVWTVVILIVFIVKKVIEYF